MFPFIILILLFLAFVIHKRKTLEEFIVLQKRAATLFTKIPGPPTMPLIGAAHQFKLDPKEFMNQTEQVFKELCYNNESRCGLLSVWIGPAPITIIESPDMIRDILESNTLITKSMQYDIISKWIGTGLLTSTNEKWFSRRKMLTPSFHFTVLKSYSEIFTRQSEVMSTQLEADSNTGREVDLFPYIKKCALDIICETAMGTSINAQGGANSLYVDSVARLSDIIFSFFRFPWLWIKPVWYISGMGFEFDRLVKITNDFTRKVISERRKALIEEGKLDGNGNVKEGEKNQKMAFLDLLLLKQREASLTDEDIREEVDTFMFEGHDTTASAMAFCVWFVGQNNEIQERIHEEVDEVLGDREVEETDLKRLVYLERCIKETLRLRPSVPFIARRLTHDITLRDFVLPENMTVIMSPISAHRDPQHWEYPDDFYPDHFTAEASSTRHSYAYFPFSAGPRNCVGQKFALAEEKTVLATLFRKYRVESVEPTPGNIAVPEVVLKPSDGVRVRLYRRAP